MELLTAENIKDGGVTILAIWFAVQLLKRMDKVTDGITAALAGAVVDMQFVKGEIAALPDRVAERVRSFRLSDQSKH